MRGFRHRNDQIDPSAASILASRYAARIVPDLRIERVEELQFVDGRRRSGGDSKESGGNEWPLLPSDPLALPRAR
jgi:hypothetical protein